MNDSSEKTIWNLFIEGDVNAFSTLFKTYYSQLHNYGLKISGISSITEDCLQNLFVYLYNNRKNLGSVTHIKSYLFISFRRALLNSLKKERKYVLYDEVFENLKVFEFCHEELIIEQEFTKIRTRALVKLLNNLSAREREVIYLRYYSSLCNNEISDIMGISYQSVLNTLQKAFAKLRAQVEARELEQVFKIV